MIHIISFSGGCGSAIAAEMAVNKYGSDNVLLLFADSLMEDESLYKFNKQVSEFLGCTLITITEGRTPWEVFADAKYLGNTRIDPCSRALKRNFIRKWLKRNFCPEECNIHIGIDCSEEHRLAPVCDNNKPYVYRSMLVENDVFIHPEDKIEWCVDRGIDVPTLYTMGFSHNNCGGFCIKAGLGHYKKLYEQFPTRYAQHEKEQEKLMVLVPEVRPFLRKMIRGKTRYITLRDYRIEFLSRGASEEDKFDIGGCGCAL